MSDEINPAVSRLTTVPPALLEEVMADPAKAQPVIRAMGVQQLAELHLMRNNMSAPQRMQLAEMTAKLGDLVPRQKQESQSSGAVTINFVRSAEKSVTIEANAITVEE